MKTWTFVAAGVLAMTVAGYGAGKTVRVGLDCWHNLEPKPHYNWDQADAGGYSKFGAMLKELGGTLDNLDGPLMPDALKNVDLLIITDPDIPQEAKGGKPNYITPAEASAVEAWVKQGGALVLMGNNPGNAEFKNFNALASRFGIRFNENTADTADKTPANPVGKYFDVPAGQPFFKNVNKLCIAGMSDLTLAPPAEPLLVIRKQTLMARAKLGKGIVFAIGDPWLYNEYIGEADNRAAGQQIFQWMFSVVGK